MISGENIVLGIITSILGGWLSALIIKSKSFNEVLYHMGRKSINDNILDDILDYDNGCALQLFDNDNSHVYVGHLFGCEEKAKESYIVLRGYSVYLMDAETEELTVVSEKTEYESLLCVNLSDIRRIQVYYPENSNIADM